MNSSRIFAVALLAGLNAVPALLAQSSAASSAIDSRAEGDRATAPATPEPGLYVLPPDDSAPADLVRLHMRMPDDMRQSGTMGMMLTRGLAKGRMHAKYAGARADVRVPAGDLSFHFYFGENAGKLPDAGDPASSMAAFQARFGDAPPIQATHADQFQLVRLTVEGDARSAETGAVGGRKGASGESRDAVPFRVEKLGERHFRVQPAQPLTPGEYGFYFADTGPGAQLWDFGVDPS